VVLGLKDVKFNLFLDSGVNGLIKLISMYDVRGKKNYLKVDISINPYKSV